MGGLGPRLIGDSIGLGDLISSSSSFLSVPRCIPHPRGQQWHFGLDVALVALGAGAFPSTRTSARTYKAFKHQGFILRAARIFGKKIQQEIRTFYSA